MWGWKPAERTIEPSINLEQASMILRQEGFETRVTNPNHMIFRRAGTQLTLNGEQFPIEVAIAKSEKGLFLQLRYDGFALFDTGDLDKLAGVLAAKLRA